MPKRIALDAMGGDTAPHSMVQGALDYARTAGDTTVILVGDPARIEAAIAEEDGPRPRNLEIREATQVIGMAEKIAALKEKPDDSINVTARMLRSGEADAAILCGNTGCSVAASQLHLGRIPGVKRAGILTPLPSSHGTTWVCDCGANSVCKPEWLAQFAELTCIFLQCYTGADNPRVGVLSIGSEDTKGDELTGGALELLRKTDLNIIGNVEGNDVFTGAVDVVTCDGFTGNVMLKTAEGVVSAVKSIIKEGVGRSPVNWLGYFMMKPAFRHLKDRLDWAKVGGCLLLGVNGLVVIGHGRSNRLAVASAFRQADRCLETGVMDSLRTTIKKYNRVTAS